MHFILPRWLANRLFPWRFRAEAKRKAADLIQVYGSFAYEVAREEARRGQRGPRRDPFWTEVALAVAKQCGRTVGITVADRYR